MAAGWNKGKRVSDEIWKKISIGRLNSPLIQAKKAENRRLMELKRQARLEERQHQREIWGSFSPESRARMSEAHKGCTPWNKGIKAWNNGHRWNDTVRDNISKGMILCWQLRKLQQEQQKQ